MEEEQRGAGAGGGPAFLFDLDGTLVDSVYQHVLAWREAMAAVGIELAVWTIHRRIGMSGGLMANAILRETGHVVSTEEASRLLRLHAEAYARLAGQVVQESGGVLPAGEHRTRLGGHFGERRGFDQELPDFQGLAGEHLFGEILEDVRLARRADVERAVRGGQKAKAGGPAFGQRVHPLRVGLRDAEPENAI